MAKPIKNSIDDRARTIEKLAREASEELDVLARSLPIRLGVTNAIGAFIYPLEALKGRCISMRRWAKGRSSLKEERANPPRKEVYAVKLRGVDEDIAGACNAYTKAWAALVAGRELSEWIEKVSKGSSESEELSRRAHDFGVGSMWAGNPCLCSLMNTASARMESKVAGVETAELSVTAEWVDVDDLP